MSSALKERINNDMKAAMKAGEKDKVQALRFLYAGIRKKEIDSREDLDDAGVVALIQTSLKQRRDSVAQYEAGNRPDLVAKEQFEIQLLSGYLPQQLDTAELDTIIRDAIATTGAKSAKDLGQVMKAAMPKVAGRADNKVLSGRIKELLS